MVDASWVPWIVGLSDIVLGLASGMTIKFFPLFFQNEAHLSPMAVNAIYVISPFCVSGISKILQRISLSYGRVQVILISKVFGVSLLVAMGLSRAYWQTPAVIIPLYVL